MTTKNQKEFSTESLEIFHFTFNTFYEMKTYAKDWSYHYIFRFGTQPFNGRYDICQNKVFQIANCVYSDGLMYSGHSPKDTITLSVVMEKDGSLTANKKILNSSEILVLDDSTEFEITFSHSVSKGVVSLRKDFVNTHFPYLTDMVNKVYDDQNHTLQNLVLQIREMTESTECDIQSKIIESIKSLSLEKQNEISKKLSKKEVLIFNVRDHIIKNIEENITIEALALDFNMSEKTLQTSFKKIFGYTPKKFIKLLKLNLAYRDIVENDGSKTISDIAMKYGFGNFGLFSAEYKDMYGFLPSENRKHPSFPSPSDTSLGVCRVHLFEAKNPIF